MAIRKLPSGAWQVYWNNPITCKREGKTFASKAEAQKEDSLIKHRLRFDRGSFQASVEADQEAVFTLDRVYYEYLLEKQFTLKNLECHRSKMLYPLLNYGEKPMAEFTTEDFENIKSHYQADKSISTATVHTRLSALRAVVYWAIKKGYMDAIVFPTIPRPHYKSFIPPTPEELSALYSASAPHIKRVIVIGAYLGVRIGGSELLRLTWEDVDLKRMIMRIHGSKKNPNSLWREVPIRQNLKGLFEHWWQEDQSYGATYLINIKGKAVGSIKHAWKNALIRANINRNIRPYDLRHAFGTELVAAGVDIGTVAKLMGHSSPVMLLKHYQFVMDKQKRNAVEALPENPSMCTCTWTA